MNRYTKVRKIGEGSFGKAVLVRSKTNGEHYVIKEISISKMQPKERQEARKEVDLLSKMRHPYIVHYVESFEEVGCLYIVMEYCEGGDLYARINSQRGIPFSEAKILEWFVQICLALKHVHDRKILHRDIKTSNIFLTKTGVIKLGDFGIARVLNSTTELSKTWIGTPYYLSPEICENKPYNNKSDIWALGCVLYEVLTLKHAFEAGNMKNLVLKIIRGSYPPVPSRYSYDLRGLVGQLFRRNPRDRPSANTILRQPFVYKHVGKFLSPEQCQDEFSHTVLHKNRKPSASRPSSAQVKPEPRAVKSPVDYRAKQIAGVYGHAAAAAPKPSNAALKYKRLAEQRKKAQEQERKAKLDAMRKKKEEIERKQQQDLARLRLLQADKIRQRQLRKDRDRALQINLKRSSDIFDEKKNGREEKPSNKNDQALPAKLPRPTSAPSQVQPQRYEKYHQYLARMRQANDQRPVVNAPARNEPVREAWNEREGAQRAAMEAIGNKIEAQMGADRAQAASKYAKMREGAENQGRIMMHQQPKPVYPSQAAPGMPEVKGRNEEEKEYLKRLQQIRIQNFNERRAMEERRKGLQYMGNFKPAPDRLKQNKISALQKQRESVMQDGNVQKSPPNVVPAVNYLPGAKAPVGITQALGAIGINHSPEINQQQYVEPKVTEPTPASPGPNPVVKKNILKRLNEKYLSEEPEKEQKPAKPRSAWANNPSAKASSNMAGGDIGNVLAAKPLEETASNQKESETMAPMKKWGQPSNTLVNRLNLLSLCDPSITLEDVDEETPGNKTRILPKPSIPANQQPPVKFTVNLGKTDDVPKSSVSDKPPVPKKGTVVLGDKSAAALPSTPEVDETLSQPKPSRVASLAAKFGGAGKEPKQATFVVGNDNVTDGKEPDAVPEEIVVFKSSDIKAITPQNSQLSPTQSSTKGSIDVRTPHASESASSTDAQTPKNSLDSADKASSPTQEESKSDLNAVADSSSTEPVSSVTRTSSGDKELIEPKTPENVQATPSPAKLHKTMYATASDEMVLKITMGHFDSPNPKLLRTCSMPDLAKVGASDEKGPNPTSARRLSDGQALDDMDQEKSTVDSDLENDDDSCIGEALSEDEEAESLMAKLENALQIGDMASSEEEDIEWESDGDDDSDTNDSDVSDTESVFSRLEANREELERELGFEEFMKAYKYVQAIHEDENDDMKDCEDRIRKILGKNHDRFYNKILQLVMADGAYCEDNN